MLRRTLAAISLAVALGACFDLSTVSTQNVQLAPHVTDWRDEMIYQVIVDRFADGDTSNNWRVNRTALARYQGGDWQGLLNQLDYVQALGVTTLWISPIVRNVETDSGIDGYHGYWASDLAELNPHFGDLGLLRRLVNEAHRRNLRVIVDIVANHMGQMFYYDINQNGRPDDNVYGGGPNNGFENPGGVDSTLQQVSEYDPDYNTLGAVQSFTSLGPAGPAPVIFLNMPDIFRVPPGADRPCMDGMDLSLQPACNSWQAILGQPVGYHRHGRIVNYVNVNHQPGDEVMLGDFPGGLKDVATERQDVRDAMVQAYARWVELTDIDGFRIDTIKHVEHGFWQYFNTHVRQRLAAHGKTNFLLFGEAFDGDDPLIGSYTAPGEFDSVVYFSQKYQIYQNVFQCEQATQAVQDLYAQRATDFNTVPQPTGATAAPHDLLVNFMDNHDVPRFLAGLFGGDLTSCPTANVSDDASFQHMRQRLLAALVYLYTEDGIPVLYYGTEQDFHGGNDPSNREVLWESATDYATHGDLATSYPTTGETFQRIARLTRIRRAYAPLRHGTFDIKWVTPRTQGEEDAGMLAFERHDATSGTTVLVAINAHSAGQSHTMFNGTPMQTSFAAGTQLVDVLATGSARTFTVDGNGAVVVDLQPWESVILVPQGQQQALGM